MKFYNKEALATDGIPIISHDYSYRGDQIGALSSEPLYAAQMLTFAIIKDTPYFLLSRRSDKAPMIPGEICPFGGKSDYLRMDLSNNELRRTHPENFGIAKELGALVCMENPIITAIRELKEEFGNNHKIYLLTGTDKSFKLPSGYRVFLASSFMLFDSIDQITQAHKMNMEVAGLYLIKIEDFLKLEPESFYELFLKKPSLRLERNISRQSNNGSTIYKLLKPKGEDEFVLHPEDLVGVEQKFYRLQSNQGLIKIFDNEIASGDNRSHIWRSGESAYNLLTQIGVVNNHGKFRAGAFSELVKKRVDGEFTLEKIVHCYADMCRNVIEI